MRLLTLYILFYFGLHSLAMAQQTEFRGAVLDNEDGKRIAGALVFNQNSKEFVETNTMGLFSIKGNEGDSLSITRSDYNEVNTVLQGTADIIVRMKPSFQLEEVNVYGQSKKGQLEDVMDDFRKKGNYYNGKPPALSYIFTPISALYGLLGKTPNNARRFQNYMNIELEQSLVDRKFPIHLVQSITGLSDGDLINFMDLYRPSFYQVENWNEYDARTYIKKSFDNFERDGRPAAPKLPRVEIPKQEK